MPNSEARSMMPYSSATFMAFRHSVSCLSASLIPASPIPKHHTHRARCGALAGLQRTGGRSVGQNTESPAKVLPASCPALTKNGVRPKEAFTRTFGLAPTARIELASASERVRQAFAIYLYLFQVPHRHYALRVWFVPVAGNAPATHHLHHRQERRCAGGARQFSAV